MNLEQTMTARLNVNIDHVATVRRRGAPLSRALWLRQ